MIKFDYYRVQLGCNHQLCYIFYICLSHVDLFHIWISQNSLVYLEVPLPNHYLGYSCQASRVYSIYFDSCAFGGWFPRKTGALISKNRIEKVVHICIYNIYMLFKCWCDIWEELFWCGCIVWLMYSCRCKCSLSICHYVWFFLLTCWYRGHHQAIV